MRQADRHEQHTFGSMASKIALVLNGPPNVGKDTLALAFTEAYPHFQRLEFKHVLYVKTAEYYDIPLHLFKERATDRDCKDLLWPGRSQSPREMLIHVSEDVIKPEHGDDYFGLCTAQMAAARGDNWVITDGGFQPEVAALGKYFDHVAIIQLYRADCNFDNDSRNYIESDDDAYNFRIDLKVGEEEEGLSDLVRVAATVLSYGT